MNSYRSPIQPIPATSGRRSLPPIVGSILAVIAVLLVGLQITGGLVAFGSMIWLIVRGFKDAVVSDVILFVTSISLVAYVFARWGRAKAPVLICICGFVAMFVGELLAQL